jgi:hypothetical protein
MEVDRRRPSPAPSPRHFGWMAWSGYRTGRLVTAAFVLASLSVSPAPAARLKLERAISDLVRTVLPNSPKKRVKRVYAPKASTAKFRLPQVAPVPTASPYRVAEADQAFESDQVIAEADRIVEAGPGNLSTGTVPASLLAFAPMPTLAVPMPTLPAPEPAIAAPMQILPDTAPALPEPELVVPEPELVVVRPEPIVPDSKPALQAVPPNVLAEEEAKEAAKAEETEPELGEVVLASVPVPQWRPDVSTLEPKEERQPYVDPAGTPRSTTPAEEASCRVRLRDLGVEFAELGFISDPAGCAVANPISIKSFGAGIDLAPNAIMNCAMAEAAASFVQETIAPAAQSTFGSELASIEHGSAYLCRPRHGTGKLSEHAFGNALDIMAFQLKDGRRVEVRDTEIETEAKFLSSVRTAACGPFNTVLGPGAADHDNHFHLDLQPRKSDSAVCQ